jgi:hypothetical protein
MLHTLIAPHDWLIALMSAAKNAILLQNAKFPPCPTHLPWGGLG